MALNVDLSKPLDEETIADLRSRLPLAQVERLVELAEASETPDEGDPGASAGVDTETAGEDPSGTSEDPFDPTTHNVDQVLAHLITASPEEADRILEAERAGKARRGILDA